MAVNGEKRIKWTPNITIEEEEPDDPLIALLPADTPARRPRKIKLKDINLGDLKTILFNRVSHTVLNRIDALGRSFSLDDILKGGDYQFELEYYVNFFESRGLIECIGESYYRVSEKGRVFLDNLISDEAVGNFFARGKNDRSYPVVILLAAYQGINSYARFNAIASANLPKVVNQVCYTLFAAGLMEKDGSALDLTEIGKEYAKELYKKIKAIEDYLGLEDRIILSEEQVKKGFSVEEPKRNSNLTAEVKPMELSYQEISIVPKKADDHYLIKKNKIYARVVLSNRHCCTRVIDEGNEKQALVDAVNYMRRCFPNEGLGYARIVTRTHLIGTEESIGIEVYKGRII